MKYIALCTNIPDFDRGKEAWNDKSICDKYPGSHWVSYLEKIANENGFTVYPGRIVKNLIEKKEITPDQVYLVQEEDNSIGTDLFRLKCNPSAIFCLESPLYAPFFYDKIEFYKMAFKHQIFFGDLGNHRAYFPSFDETIEINSPNFHSRKLPDKEFSICMIAANKHYGTFADRFYSSKTFQEIIPHQLHDIRMEAILNLKPDLYGNNWWGEIKSIPPGEKIKVMHQYQYAICFENLSYPGYVTEKIIDCLVAGTIPIYLGAPDIASYIPSECWIDMKGKTFNGIKEFMRSCCSTHNHYSYLYHGRKFLKSDQGKKFSYQSFARTVIQCLHEA